MYVGLNKWITLVELSGTMPSARCGHSATVINGKMFVFGGKDERGCNNDLYVLDLVRFHWVRLDCKGGMSARSVRILALASAYDGARVLICSRCRSVALPTARMEHAAIAIDDRFLLIHGGSGDGGILNTVHLLDTSTYS